jgi:DNA-binding NtrC family response regulator
MSRAKLVVLEPDPARRGDCTVLGPPAPEIVGSEAELLERLAAGETDLVIVPIAGSGEADVELLERIRAADAHVAIVVLAGRPTFETATLCHRLGAGEVLAAPPRGDDLRQAVDRLLAQRRVDEELALLRRQVERPYSFDDITGTSPAMQKVFQTIDRVSASDVDVLIRGETGTGKELIARAIHRRSRRAGKPFVPVDCGAIPESLLESEFFGHERGAFTGAEARRIGLLEFADGGTFFLDEIGELPQLLQAKLLRTLQERRIRRVGGREEIPVDVRIVAATARDLEGMIREKRFRDDLYYRIHVVQIDLPPLRDRGDDLGLLAEQFAVRYSREMGKSVTAITPEAYQVLRQYHWPGNVRELQNAVRRAIALTHDAMIGVDDLPDEVVAAAGRNAAGGGRPSGFFALRDECLARFEREYLTQLLRSHHGNVKLAAQEANLPRGTLYRLLKSHGLDSAAFR